MHIKPTVSVLLSRLSSSSSSVWKSGLGLLPLLSCAMIFSRSIRPAGSSYVIVSLCECSLSSFIGIRDLTREEELLSATSADFNRNKGKLFLKLISLDFTVCVQLSCPKFKTYYKLLEELAVRPPECKTVFACFFFRSKSSSHLLVASLPFELYSVSRTFQTL